MAEEQEQQGQVQAPTNEQVTAWMSGDQGQSEQSGAQTPPRAPAQQEQAPQASTAPTASPDLAAQLQELLKKELNPLQSELGQLRRVRSEFEKFKAAQTQNNKPTSFDQLPPEEQEKVLELVDAAWARKYGKQWESVTQHFQTQQQREAIQSVESTAREIAGESWKDLDPIMGRLFTELTQKAEQGDPQAQRFAWEVANTESGVHRLVMLAKQELSQSVQATEQKAVSQRQVQAKKAGTALNSAPQAAGAEDNFDALKKLPADKLRAYLMEKGAFQ